MIDRKLLHKTIFPILDVGTIRKGKKKRRSAQCCGRIAEHGP